MKRYGKHLRFLASLSLVLTLAACGGSDNDDDNGNQNTTASGSVRVIHAAPDAPAVNVDAAASGGGSAQTLIQALDYGENSGFADVDAGTYDFDVMGIIPGGNQTVIDIDGVSVTDGSRTTLVAVGTADANDAIDLETLTLPEPAADPASDEVSISVLHAATAAGNVDVYVTAPGTDVSTTSPTFTFDYTGSVDASTAVSPLPAQNYQIQVTAAGSDTVVYDSGTVDLSPFAGSKISLIAVNTTNSTTQDAAPIKLLAISGGDVIELLDTATQAGVKVAHVSPNAGDVDVTVDGSIPGPLSGVPYLGVAGYLGLDAGTYDLNVQGAGSGSDVLSSDVSVDLTAGTEYSVLALGNVGDSGDTAFGLTPTPDSNRAVATQVSVKVVHGAPAVGAVDVYVTAAGTVSVAEIEGGMGGTPLLSDFAFGELSDYVSVAPGDYDVRVLDRSSDTVIIDAAGTTLSGGDVITAIAHQADTNDNDPANPGLLLLTN